MNEKKLRKSPIVIAMYVIAALVFVYCLYLLRSTLSYISSYYESYNMEVQVGEVVSYILQSVFQPFVSAVLLASAGYILNEVRALNPAYYTTKEEIEAAKAAKAAKKAEKEAAKKAEKEAKESKEETAAEVKTAIAESQEEGTTGEVVAEEK